MFLEKVGLNRTEKDCTFLLYHNVQFKNSLILLYVPLDRSLQFHSLNKNKKILWHLY